MERASSKCGHLKDNGKKMRRHRLRVQKLFLVAFILKVTFAGLSVVFDSPWIMGFAIPLLVMAVYIGLGLTRSLDDVTDDKFADSCYYLGFIFTITSIVASLFDLPSIGTHITDIGIRFGAAMISTVLGLGVRVYLIGFREETSDAIQAVEDSLVDSSKRFREQLGIAIEKLKEFDETVNDARKLTVERLQLQLTEVGKEFGQKLGQVFEQLAGQHQKVSQDTFDDITEVTARLAVSIDTQTEGLKEQLGKVEERVNAFTEAIKARLERTTFPDDFFKSALEEPLRKLSGAVEDMSSGVRAAASDVKAINKEFSPTIRAVKKRAEEMDQALEQMAKTARAHEDLLKLMTSTSYGVKDLETSIRDLAQQVQSNSANNSEKLQELSRQNVAALREITVSVQTLLENMRAGAEASREQLHGAVTQVGNVVARLESGPRTGAEEQNRITAENTGAVHLLRASLQELDKRLVSLVEATGDQGGHGDSDKVSDLCASIQDLATKLDVTHRTLAAQAGQMMELVRAIGSGNAPSDAERGAQAASHSASSTTAPDAVRSFP